MSIVSLIKGDNRRENTIKSLELIASDIDKDVLSRQIVIKPNFVSTSKELAATHIDQVRGILDYFKNIYTKKIIIAESAPNNTRLGYENFGYYDLLHEYNIELVDLNDGPFEELSILDKAGRTIHVKVSRLLFETGTYVISSAKLKTHDTVIVTLSIKNIIMGSIYSEDKQKVHQGYKQTNRNIAQIADHVWPSLSIIDGFVGMEGDGPENGTPLKAGVAIASVDPLTADVIGCKVMGVDFNDVGYLHYCSQKRLGSTDLSDITIVGDSLGDCIKPFKLHHTAQEQYRWRDDDN